MARTHGRPKKEKVHIIDFYNFADREKVEFNFKKFKVGKYKQFHRIFPKLKLSYTLYKLWVRKDWDGVWQYLTGLGEAYTSEAMDNGKEVHKFLEEHSLLPQIRDIVGTTKRLYKEKKIELEMDYYRLAGILDVSTPHFIIDYKTGATLNGYQKQLEFYGYLSFLERGKIPEQGMLVLVEGKRTKAGKLRGVNILKTSVYDLDDKVLYWEDILYDMYNDIAYEIKKGSLDKFLELNQ